jgi:hypothetical protein
VEQAVRRVLGLGYRSLETASVSDNEVGSAERFVKEVSNGIISHHDQECGNLRT